MTTLLTIQEVRAVLHCSRTYVYELLRNRELRAVKLGRLTRIADVELDRFLANKSAHSDDQVPDADIAAHPMTQPSHGLQRATTHHTGSIATPDSKGRAPAVADGHGERCDLSSPALNSLHGVRA